MAAPRRNHRELLTGHENKPSFLLNGGPSHAGYIKDLQVVVHILWWFQLLVFLANPQARTGLPATMGNLLQCCSQSQARPPSIASHLFPNPLALTCPLISVGQTCESSRNVCPWPWSAGLPPMSEDGGILQRQVPGRCVAVMLVRAASTTSNPSCGSSSTQEQPPHYTNTAQVNACRKGFKLGKLGACSSRL